MAQIGTIVVKGLRGHYTKIITTFRHYVRRHLHVDSHLLSDRSLDEIASFVTGNSASPDVLDSLIQTVSGKAITDHYAYMDGWSCMSGPCAWKVRIYADNPDKVSLVVFDSHAHALLWTCDDGVRVLDRVYPIGTGDAMAILHEWAARHGIVYREDDEIEDGMVMLSDRQEHRVTLRKLADVFPHMDTFAYGFDRGDYIVLSNNSRFGNVEFHSMIGLHSELRRCYSCHRAIPVQQTFERLGDDYCLPCALKVCQPTVVPCPA